MTNSSLTVQEKVDRFRGLDIGGFQLEGFAYRARDKLALELGDFHRVYHTTSGDVWRTYELQFFEILGGTVETRGFQSSKVKSWTAHGESECLSTVLQARGQVAHGESFVHFELILDQGKADVVARDFFLAVLSKGDVVRTGGGGGGGIPSSIAKDRKTSSS